MVEGDGPERDDMVGLDSSIILPRQVWEASGHVDTFTDPLTECQSCHKRFRADHLQEQVRREKGIDRPDGVDLRPSPLQLRHPRRVDRAASVLQLLKTYLGVIENEEGLHYLRPDTAQGIFINFANVVTSSRMSPIPFGIAQIGKSFRNEMTPGNFIFRTREFEQMEMEYFVSPGEDEEWHRVLDRPAHALVRRPRHRPRQPAPLRAPAGEAEPLLDAHRRHRVPLPLPGHRVGASWRASPTAPTST